MGVLNIQVALKVLDSVSFGHDRMVKKVKEDVETLYQGGLTPRSRKALAFKLGITGGAFFADNVGKVTHSFFL